MCIRDSPAPLTYTVSPLPQRASRAPRRGVRAGLRSATGNRVGGVTCLEGSNPSLSATSLHPEGAADPAAPRCTLDEPRGEVAERLNAAVSKTVSPANRARGFESPPLRHWQHFSASCRVAPKRIRCVDARIGAFLVPSVCSSSRALPQSYSRRTDALVDSRACHLTTWRLRALKQTRVSRARAAMKDN